MVKATFDHKAVTLMKKAAVAHQPHKIMDPKTKKEAAHDAEL